VDVTVRLAEEDDAPALAGLLRANRAFLAPWEPVRPDGWFTDAGQRVDLVRLLARHADGTTSPYVVVADGRLVGRVTVNDIVRGAFQSAHLGYWVDREHNGRGVATAAVAAVVRIAFRDLGLHRLQADTLVHNTASQRVLARNGFTRIGLAPRYLRIAGRWQDHVLHQLLEEDWRGA
jgi:ribosomal-protein-alanine N-acetyltransferase